jgi:CHASE3 domain sensor protein
MKSDKIVKWFFIAIVLCIIAVTASLVLTPADVQKEASEKAEKSTEKMRLK